MSDDGHTAHGATKNDQAPHKSGHADAHDHHEEFDPEPAKELSAGEPRTPSWLPVLGGGLFLLGAIWFLSSGSSSANAAASASATAIVSAAPQAAKAPATAAGTAGAQQKRPSLDPEKVKALQAERDRRKALASASAAAAAGSAPKPGPSASAKAGRP